MVRIAKSVASKKRKDKIRKRAKGFWGDRKGHIGLSKSAIMKADAYNYVHRKHNKRNMRRLWSIRINIAARALGISYSRLIHGIKLAKIEINRKMLSELAIHNVDAFKQIVDMSKSSLESVSLV